MATKEEVQRFLYQMKEKVKVFGIIYRDDRGKMPRHWLIWKSLQSTVTQSSLTLKSKTTLKVLLLTLSTNAVRCGSLEKM